MLHTGVDDAVFGLATLVVVIVNHTVLALFTPERLAVIVIAGQIGFEVAVGDRADNRALGGMFTGIGLACGQRIVLIAVLLCDLTVCVVGIFIGADGLGHALSRARLINPLGLVALLVIGILAVNEFLAVVVAMDSNLATLFVVSISRDNRFFIFQNGDHRVTLCVIAQRHHDIIAHLIALRLARPAHDGIIRLCLGAERLSRLRLIVCSTLECQGGNCDQCGAQRDGSQKLPAHPSISSSLGLNFRTVF